MSIFDKRIKYKPFEYPEVMTFINAINTSFWVHSEVDFTADTQDFLVKLKPHEQEAVKRALLSIAQIEVSVKSFWGNLYNTLPKPEFNGLGSTFAECEFRHSEAYSRLLEVLGLVNEFDEFVKTDLFKARVNNVEKAFSNTQILNNEDPRIDFYYKTLVFTILIENVSLFSQFATILSFPKFKGYMKNVSNIIAWTSIDEQLHANGGIYLLNEMRKELDDLFSDRVLEDLNNILDKALEHEEKLLDWIFEEGELDTFSKYDLSNFMKLRLNEALDKLDLQILKRKVDMESYSKMKWFEEEVFSNAQDDFFAKRPVEYTKHDKPVTGDDLF